MGNWNIGTVLVFALLAALSSCRHGAPQKQESPADRAPHTDKQTKTSPSYFEVDTTPGTFTTIPLEDANYATPPLIHNQLSGLAIGGRGELWTVAERQDNGPHMVYRIELSPTNKVTIIPFTIKGIPHDIQLEGIAVLDDEGTKFSISTENDDQDSTVFFLNRKDDELIVKTSKTIHLKHSSENSLLGDMLKVTNTRGAEGICGYGDTLFVAMESVQDRNSSDSWAPILRIDNRKLTGIYKLVLQRPQEAISSYPSAKHPPYPGAVSSLDCKFKGDSVTATAIQKDLGIKKLLFFEFPKKEPNPKQFQKQREDKSFPELEIDHSLDISSTFQWNCSTRERIKKILPGRCGPNLEGVASDPGGSIYLIFDNQQGAGEREPNKLLILKPKKSP